MMILLMIITNIRAEKIPTCDVVLDKCYKVTQEQKHQIDTQDELIKKQDDKIKSLEQINADLEKNNNILKYTSAGGTILVLLLNLLRK